jgi:hypothetical protein
MGASIAKPLTGQLQKKSDPSAVLNGLSAIQRGTEAFDGLAKQGQAGGERQAQVALGCRWAEVAAGREGHVGVAHQALAQGPAAAERYLRLSFATGLPLLREAVERLGAALNR